MNQLTRVPAPRSPFDGRWGALGVLAALAVVVLLVKPWGSESGRQAASARPWTTDAPGSPRAVVVGRPYEPAAFGPTPPDPAWEVWAADQHTRVPFVGPPGEQAGPSGAPGPTAVTGPVVPLGAADRLTVLAVNHPRGVELATVRLWRLTTGGQPARLALIELATPWPGSTVRVFAPWRRGLARDEAVPWSPGLYRLDLLVHPAGRIRSLLLSVDAPATVDAGAPSASAEAPALDPRLLRRLPPAARVWAFTDVLTGWAHDGAPQRCRVAEIWLAEDIDAACHPTPVGRPTSLGVNLPPGRVVRSIELVAVDPLPGAVGGVTETRLLGRPGLARVSVGGAGLADGIYRLTAGLAGGDVFTWYVEVDDVSTPGD